MSDTPTLTTIALDQIAPSPSNPRKKFDEAALAELAESIRSKGVLHPVLLRPARAGPDLSTFLRDIPGLLPSGVAALVNHGVSTLAGLVARGDARVAHHHSP